MTQRVKIDTLAVQFGPGALTFYLPARPDDVSWDDFHIKNVCEKAVKPFKAVEGRYKLADGYKMILICMEPGHADEEYYQADFESIARSIPDYYVGVGDQVFRFGYDEVLPAT
jgi:hypothetical protein